jgi:hypothetical protein
VQHFPTTFRNFPGPADDLPIGMIVWRCCSCQRGERMSQITDWHNSEEEPRLSTTDDGWQPPCPQPIMAAAALRDLCELWRRGSARFTARRPMQLRGGRTAPTGDLASPRWPGVLLGGHIGSPRCHAGQPGMLLRTKGCQGARGDQQATGRLRLGHQSLNLDQCSSELMPAWERAGRSSGPLRTEGKPGVVRGHQPTPSSTDQNNHMAPM